MAEAYGQTDVLHDPNFLMNAMRTRDPRMHEYYRTLLEQVNRDQSEQETLRAREQARQENIAARESTAREGRLSREQIERGRQEDRQERQQALERARGLEQQRLTSEDRDREVSRLIDTAGKLPPTDPRARQLQDRAMQMLGLPTAPATAGAVHPAIAGAAKALGERPAATQGAATATGGTAAVAPPAGAAGTPPTGAPPTGTLAPAQLATPPPGETPQGEPLSIQRNVMGGNIVGPLAGTVPQGYDLNVNTGERVPSGFQGTINGRPVGEELARGFMATNIAPESRTGEAGVKNLLEPPGGGFAGTPTLPVGPTGIPGFGGRPIRPNLSAPTTPPTTAPPTGAPPATAGTTPGAPSTSGGPQRDLVPADYIAHGLGMAAHAISSGLGMSTGPFGAPVFSPANLTSQPKTPQQAPGAQVAQQLPPDNQTQ